MLGVELRREVGFKLSWIWELNGDEEFQEIKEDNRNLFFSFKID